MNAQQWQRVKEVFGDALTVAAQQRTGFIIGACGDDDQVRREVEKLVSSFDDGYMQEPAITEVAKQCDAARVEVGEIISHYRIERLIGTGGMGEVYLAEDINLGRNVAIKFLPPDSAFDPSAEKRLIREARAAAALDHPNICAVYEVCDVDGIKFIVMQYLRGETLADRLARERIPLNQALEIAIQIADALSEAHAGGVVHRDIKPSNVIIDSPLKVKVLDFGLAKRSALNSEESVESMFSRPGLIFGTIAYMSPEQVRGEPTDGRTDIWSLGVLMFEMLTGQKPFLGTSTSDTIAAILKSEPRAIFDSGSGELLKLESVVAKALGKDLDDRYQQIKDLWNDLKGLKLNEPQREDIEHFSTGSNVRFDSTEEQKISTGVSLVHVTLEDGLAQITRSLSKRTLLVWAAASILIIVGTLSFYWWRSTLRTETRPADKPPSVPQKIASWKRTVAEDPGGTARFSPDGKLVAFASTQNGVRAIWLKQISGGEAFTTKQDQWPESSPVFSPNGEQIAFLSKRGDEYGIWARRTFGGGLTLLCSVDNGIQEILKWSNTDHLYIASRNAVFSLDLATKSTEKLWEMPNIAQTRFAIAPDDDRIGYIDVQNGRSDIWVVTMSDHRTARVTDDEFKEGDLAWYPDGKRIIYDSVRDGISQIFIRGLNNDPPERLSTSSVSLFVSDVSPNGEVLSYSPRNDADLWSIRIDDQKETRLTDSLDIEIWARGSLDGSKVIYQRAHTDDPNLRIVKSAIVSESLTPEHRTLELTNDGYLPTWSPDQKRIAFLRSSDGQANLWTMSSEMGQEKQLTTDGVTFGGLVPFPSNTVQAQDYQWSQDSKSIVYCARRSGISNVWRVNLDGSGETQLTDNDMADIAGPWFFSPVISHSGERIAFLRMDPGNEKHSVRTWSIWTVDQDGTRKVFESDALLGIVGWSDSERDLIVRSTTALNSETAKPTTVDLLEIPADRDASRILHHITDAYSRNICLSPDTEFLAYVKRTNGVDTMHVVATYGREDREILTSDNERVYFTGLAWAPDGKSIYFGKEADWQVISIMGNSKEMEERQ